MINPIDYLMRDFICPNRNKCVSYDEELPICVGGLKEIDVQKSCREHMGFVKKQGLLRRKIDDFFEGVLRTYFHIN